MMVSITAPSINTFAGCSGWTEYAREGGWYCEANDGCGAFFVKGTLTQRVKYIRYCSEDGNQVKDFKYGPAKNGCCFED